MSPLSRNFKVNLCVSQQYFLKFIDNNTADSCDQCLRPQRVFRKDESMRGFVNYIMEGRRIYKFLCVMAHNGQGYDFQMVLKYILENTKIRPELMAHEPWTLSASQSIWSRFWKEERILPAPLQYATNTEYIGLMPDRKYFCPETMCWVLYCNYDKCWSCLLAVAVILYY